MKKKIKYSIILAATIVLTGCAGIEETYRQGAFHTAEFADNYYRYMPEKYQTNNYTETVYDITNNVFLGQPLQNAFYPIMLSDLGAGVISLEEMVELYGNQAVKDIKLSDYNGNEGQYRDAVMTALSTSTSATWFNYALHNSLSTGNFGESVNNAFKKGYFSKLTDTIILCDTTGSLVRMQIDEDGIGEVFDHELINYRNFVFSARGGTNLDFGALGINRIRTAKVRINISFYIEQSTLNPTAEKVTLSYIVDELQTDDSGTTTIMSVDLTRVLPAKKLERVSGMTFNYELLDHDYLMPGGVVDPAAEGEFALMLYEVMFPYSTWR